MGLADDLRSEVRSSFKAHWQTRDGSVVPDTTAVQLGNNAVGLQQATVLYADLAQSTTLVEESTPEFAAEVYKTFLYCASKVIRAEGGSITAFDGDRVMAVFLGDRKNTSAVRAALKIHYAMREIIAPEIQAVYQDASAPSHAVGIDTSALLVARAGIRGSNDLIWIGRAANYAAKLAAIRQDPYRTYITPEVHRKIAEAVKHSDDGRDMWEAGRSNEMGIEIHASDWWISF